MKRLLVPLLIAVFLVCALEVMKSPQEAFERDGPSVRGPGLRASFAYESMRWYNYQRSFPAGSIPADWREKALAHAAAKNAPKVTSAAAIGWTFLGPNNIGGRIRSIAIDPLNSSTIYCGSVSGGIWKSTDGGGSWVPVNDFMPNLVVGSLAIDPTNPNIIYAGTGEGYSNFDALRGIGVLKSTDGGSSWTVLNSFTGSPSGFPYYVNDLYIRPDLPSTIYAATHSGVFRTTNSGANWAYIRGGTSTNRALQIVADATAPQTFYVSFGHFIREGIHKTTNGGSNWTKLNGGGFPASGYNRIRMGISKSSPQIIYAALTDSATLDCYGIVKSTNGGANWTTLTKPLDGLGSYMSNQGWYNSVVAVHPTDPNTVFVGGINTFKSTNAGATWTKISSSTSMHVDQHAIEFSPANPSVMYFGNDGGMYKSTNGGLSFLSANSNLAVTQFYSGAAHPTQEIYYGGTQDNGTLKGSGTLAWGAVIEGDGGFTYVDQTTPTTVFTEYTFLALLKSTNSGSTWGRIMTGIPTTGTRLGDGSSDRCNFIAPFVMDPKNPQNLVAGTYRVYRTTNGGTNWSTISGDLTGSGAGSTYDAGSVISAMATIGDTVIIGTSGYDTLASAPKIQVRTSGTTWVDVTKSPLPKRYVTSIAIDVNDSRRVVVGYSGYNANSSAPGHVFRTTNRGTTWTNITGDLPDIPVNAIVLDPGSQTHFVVGTDVGVFETTNGGTNWIAQNNGMANVSVADLDLRPDGSLVATTHGRGMFKSSWLTAVAEVPSELPAEFSLRQNYPNPFNPTTTIAFSVPAATHVRLTVYDALGREVAVLADEELAPGSYKAPFDASRLASGVYFYRLTAAGAGDAGSGSLFAETKKMLLVR